jgi:hypothetical protein
MGNFKIKTEIPFYSVLNVFFVGVITVILFYGLWPNEMKHTLGVISGSAHGYVGIYAVQCLAGLIVNRVGSVVVEPLARQMKLLKWTEYGVYCEKSKNDEILSILSREYALSRSFTTLFLLISIAMLLTCNLVFFVVTLLVTLLFGCSMRKFSHKISVRCERKQSLALN